MRLTQNQKTQLLNIVVCSFCSKTLFYSKRFTASQFPYMILCLNLMTVQTIKGAVKVLIVIRY